MEEHLTRAFDADLQELALKVAEMGRIDEKQITDAIEALAERCDLHESWRRTIRWMLQHEQKAIVTIADGSLWPLICEDRRAPAQ
jgi:hypothetical protein